MTNILCSQMNPEWEDGIEKLRTHKFINSTPPLSELFNETATEVTIWYTVLTNKSRESYQWLATANNRMC